MKSSTTMTHKRPLMGRCWGHDEATSSEVTATLVQVLSTNESDTTYLQSWPPLYLSSTPAEDVSSQSSILSAPSSVGRLESFQSFMQSHTNITTNGFRGFLVFGF